MGFKAKTNISAREDLALRPKMEISRRREERLPLLSPFYKLLNKHGNFSRSKQGTGRGYFGKGAYVRAGDSLSRRVTVKARFIRHKESTRKALKKHLLYLKREESGTKGEKSVLKNEKGEEIDVAKVSKEWGKDELHWRIIISPEDGEKVNLRRLKERLLKQMECDLGTKLSSISTYHYNTDYPHIHLLIRGVREDGTTLLISRDYISRGLRYRVERLVTLSLGKRTRFERERQKLRDIKREAFTELDRGLLTIKRKSPDNNIDLRKIPKSLSKRKYRKHLISRLKFLSTLGLSEEVRPGVFSLQKNAVKILKNLSIRNDRIKTLHRSMGMEKGRGVFLGDEYSFSGKKIYGEVVKKGLQDEMKGTKYLILSGVDGNSYYVSLNKYSERAGDECGKGSIVEVSYIEGKRKLFSKVRLIERGGLKELIKQKRRNILDETSVETVPVTDFQKRFKRAIKERKEARREIEITLKE